MGTRREEFIAEELWLLIGVVTFALAGLASIAGFSGVAAVVAIVGWFLLAPIFLFWGEEVAALLGDGDDAPEPTRATEPDALDELKRRYAAGEIDDEEFEHRLERLVAVEELPDALFETGTTRARVRTRAVGAATGRSWCGFDALGSFLDQVDRRPTAE